MARMGSEKRRYERKSVHYAVRVELEGGATVAGAIENLGALGVLVSTTDFETALSEGARAEVVIEAPSEIRAAATIVRVEPEFAAGELRRALALRFDEPIDLPA